MRRFASMLAALLCLATLGCGRQSQTSWRDRPWPISPPKEAQDAVKVASGDFAVRLHDSRGEFVVHTDQVYYLADGSVIAPDADNRMWKTFRNAKDQRVEVVAWKEQEKRWQEAEEERAEHLRPKLQVVDGLDWITFIDEHNAECCVKRERVVAVARKTNVGRPMSGCVVHLDNGDSIEGLSNFEQMLQVVKTGVEEKSK